MIIGSDLLFFEDLPSTNTYTTGLLKKNILKEGTIVYTNYQSAGKGYSGNKWESEVGKNLLISIVLFPSFISPQDQFLISMTISLGICDFLERFIPLCSIKWPNDIYVNNDKIAGILIESTIIGNKIGYTIAGIGLHYLAKDTGHEINENEIDEAAQRVEQKLANLCETHKSIIFSKKYKQIDSIMIEWMKLRKMTRRYEEKQALNKKLVWIPIAGLATTRVVLPYLAGKYAVIGVTVVAGFGLLSYIYQRSLNETVSVPKVDRSKKDIREALEQL